MSRFHPFLLISSSLTAIAAVLFVLGAAVCCNSVFADEPLSQTQCGSPCECANGEGKVCVSNIYPYPDCSWEIYSCVCADLFNDICVAD